MGVYPCILPENKVLKNIWIWTAALKYLNTVNPEQCNVVAAIESEAHNIQREEIKVETNYAENKGGG